MGILGGSKKKTNIPTELVKPPRYKVKQVVLKEELIGVASGNLEEVEKLINDEFYRGYKFHSMTTTIIGSKGFGGGDRVLTTIVFEKIDEPDCDD